MRYDSQTGRQHAAFGQYFLEFAELHGLNNPYDYPISAPHSAGKGKLAGEGIANP